MARGRGLVQSGIGRDTVQRYIEEGAKVLFCGRGEDAGNEIADALGDDCVYMKCDVMVEEEIEAVMMKTGGRPGRPRQPHIEHESY